MLKPVASGSLAQGTHCGYPIAPNGLSLLRWCSRKGAGETSIRIPGCTSKSSDARSCPFLAGLSHDETTSARRSFVPIGKVPLPAIGNILKQSAAFSPTSQPGKTFRSFSFAEQIDLPFARSVQSALRSLRPALDLSSTVVCRAPRRETTEGRVDFL